MAPEGMGYVGGVKSVKPRPDHPDTKNERLPKHPPGALQLICMHKWPFSSQLTKASKTTKQVRVYNSVMSNASI